MPRRCLVLSEECSAQRWKGLPVSGPGLTIVAKSPQAQIPKNGKCSLMCAKFSIALGLFIASFLLYFPQLFDFGDCATRLPNLVLPRRRNACALAASLSLLRSAPRILRRPPQSAGRDNDASSRDGKFGCDSTAGILASSPLIERSWLASIAPAIAVETDWTRAVRFRW